MAHADFDPNTVKPDGRSPTRERLFDPATDGPWRGVVEGAALAGPVTVLAYGTDEIGVGPRLHVHPYDETFIVVAGRGRFFVGDEVLEASAGEVVFGPAAVPHRFENIGPGRLQTIDIHHSPTWIQTDLE
jgi:mannose-6-phosphate isomerase-like protein (cupin superfamily)